MAWAANNSAGTVIAAQAAHPLRTRRMTLPTSACAVPCRRPIAWPGGGRVAWS